MTTDTPSYTIPKTAHSRIDLVLQVFDEVVKLGQAGAGQAGGGEDGADVLGRGLQVIIDDDVVVFAEMLHFELGIAQALFDGAGTVLGAAFEAGAQFLDRWAAG